MAVQLVLLKSGEELIADVREIVDRDTQEQMSLVFIRPVKVTIAQRNILNEETNHPQNILNFEPWIPTSKDEEYFVDKNWVVTLCEPQEEIKDSYIQNVGVKDDSESFAIEDEPPVSDSGD
jgi:hypothetical protein